ncbi:MAG: flagellar filament capping protein FliD [Lachnospiraceae bacterium]|nr:flagellar filament capping protein FliD [Lachnospiraceae bacterium]
MAMRITGMNSGLDTESIIQELVAAKRTKVDKAKKQQTSLQWKQDIWKDLNTKLKNLQSKYLSNMRFTSEYNKLTTTLSKSGVASVVTGSNAVKGQQTLKVNELAKTAYLTGAEVKSNDGSKLTALSKLSDLANFSAEEGAEGTISLKAGSKTVDITVNADTTISDILSQAKAAGLNASFDAKQQRFFISAKNTGEDSDFSFSATGLGEDALNALGLTKESGASKIDGQNAVIELNGATFKSSNNVFEINGMTITAQAVTNGEEITLNTATDTSGVYDTIKNFLKEYNAIINEMDKLYNAASAKDYQPLTDDEKDAMSEREIDEWETKIKDSLLRRDSNLNTVSSALKSVMSAGIEIKGRTMYLSDFGINTLSYFASADNEKYAYHIDGDPDDDSTSGNEDKLSALIASDPDTVTAFFTKLSQNLYDKMTDLSTSVDGYRSFGNFFDDKKMKADYDDYTKKIKELEEKLTAYEDKWYAKFGKMETAMAKMQSNMSAVTSLLGG